MESQVKGCGQYQYLFTLEVGISISDGGTSLKRAMLLRLLWNRILLTTLPEATYRMPQTPEEIKVRLNPVMEPHVV